MKAAVVKMLGQPPIYGDFEDPQPVAGETRIAVAAASLSPLARARASGAHYSADIALPFIAGVDGVGRRDDGQRVYFLLPRAPFGAMAEWTVVPQALTLPVPDEIGDQQAAAIANPGMSSWAALVERAHVRGGETVLINGATGASGQLAIGIARHFGASRIIATGRNRTILDDLEADSVIPLNQPEAELGAAFAVCFADGVDIVLDYLW